MNFKGNRLLAVLVMLALVFTLTACNGGGGVDDADNPVLGTWELTRVSYAEVEGMEDISVEEMNEMLNGSMELSITFNFKSGGKMDADVMGIQGTGTYTVDGNTVTVDDGDMKQDLILDGDVLTLEMDEFSGMVMILERQ